MLLLVVVVVVVVSRTCDGKYFHDQLAARLDQAGRPGQAQSGWRNYLAVGKYWCKLAGWLADCDMAHHHQHHQHQEGRGKHLYPTYHLLRLL